MLFLARKNQLLLKINNSTILIIFEIITLKWIKSLTILLYGDKFMSELHLKQTGFTYSAFVHLLEIVKELKNLQKLVI